MRLGSIQKEVIAYLSDCDGVGVICVTTQSKRFEGLCFEQVERALNGVIRRGLVKKVSKVRVALAEWDSQVGLMRGVLNQNTDGAGI